MNLRKCLPIELLIRTSRLRMLLSKEVQQVFDLKTATCIGMPVPLCYQPYNTYSDSW